MVGRTISHYKVTAKLGEGGMGVVYKAEDTTLGRSVALKFLPMHLVSDAEVRKRFEREAKAAAALHHPNICTVHEIAEVNGRLFIAMALLEGDALETKIEAGPLKLNEALDIAVQVAQGLQAAHARKIVHRDIKPGNILLDAEGHATIIDFGLARLTEASRLTKGDTKMGTVAYMSPEQAQGLDVDYRSDIWALGCVLYEMISGQRPFKGEYDQALLFEICNQDQQPLTGMRTGIPPELEFIVGKCLEKDVRNRYQHVDELIVDLRLLTEKLKSDRVGTSRTTTLSSIQQGAGADSQNERNEQLQRQQRLLLVSLAVTVVLLLVVLGAWLFQRPDTTLEGPLRRFAVTPAGNRPSYPAISPNGRYIVYQTETEYLNQFTLWVHDLERDERRELTSAAQSTIYSSFFWSPKSDSIALVEGQDLKRISVSGGPSLSVCDLPGRLFLGGSWSTDGATIVFSSWEPGGDVPPRLYRVAAAGGEPELLFEPLSSEGKTGFVMPYFLGGRSSQKLLFGTAIRGENAQGNVFDLDTERRGVVDSMVPVREGRANGYAYLPSGHLIWGSAGPQPNLGGAILSRGSGSHWRAISCPGECDPTQRLAGRHPGLPGVVGARAKAIGLAEPNWQFVGGDRATAIGHTDAGLVPGRQSSGCHGEGGK